MDASRFSAPTLWMCTEQNVTVGVPESEGRRSRPRTMSKHHTTCILASGVNLVCENYRVRLEGVLVEQDGEVRVAGAHKEVLRDVRNTNTGFLKNNCMKLATGSGDNGPGCH